MTDIERVLSTQEILHALLQDAQKVTVLDTVLLFLDAYLPTDANPEASKKLFGKGDQLGLDISYVVKTEVIDEVAAFIRQERERLQERMRQKHRQGETLHEPTR
jgi:hypothetical protein